MTIVIKGIEISAVVLNKAELQEFELPKNQFIAKDLTKDDIYYVIDNKYRELVSAIHQIL